MPAYQILDRGSSATHSSHAANQRANISLIDRRFRRPRRVPYLAIGFRNSPTVLRGPDLFDSVDTESHINVFSHQRATVVVKTNTKLHVRPRALGG